VGKEPVATRALPQEGGAHVAMSLAQRLTITRLDCRYIDKQVAVLRGNHRTRTNIETSYIEKNHHCAISSLSLAT